MFNYVLGIISIFFAIYGLYYAITGIFAFAKPRKEKPITNKMHKFAIIVAARNEEKVIGNLIDSLKKQNYDNDLYSINVIINNSTDKTYEVVKESGANAIKARILMPMLFLMLIMLFIQIF